MRKFAFRKNGSYELVSFVRSVESGKYTSNIEKNISCDISGIMEHFMNGDVTKIQ